MENPGEIAKILIIDDSRFVRLANQRAPTHSGHHTISAEDGELGLEIGRDRHADVILLDMMLPQLAGRDVLRALKRDARNLVSAWIAN